VGGLELMGRGQQIGLRSRRISFPVRGLEPRFHDARKWNLLGSGDCFGSGSQKERSRHWQTMLSRKAKEAGLVHQHLKRFRLRERDVIMLAKHFSITQNKQHTGVSARIEHRFLIELRAYALKH